MLLYQKETPKEIAAPVFAVASASVDATATAFAEMLSFDKGDVFSLIDLTNPPFKAGLDVSRRETYLSDAEFKSAFKMGKAEFEKLPLWKRNALKKSLGLF